MERVIQPQAALSSAARETAVFPSSGKPQSSPPRGGVAPVRGRHLTSSIAIDPRSSVGAKLKISIKLDKFTRFFDK